MEITFALMFGEFGDFLLVFNDLDVSKRTFFDAMFVPVNTTVTTRFLNQLFCLTQI